jgi:hypothetical protein
MTLNRNRSFAGLPANLEVVSEVLSRMAICVSGPKIDPVRFYSAGAGRYALTGCANPTSFADHLNRGRRVHDELLEVDDLIGPQAHGHWWTSASATPGGLR